MLEVWNSVRDLRLVEIMVDEQHDESLGASLMAKGNSPRQRGKMGITQRRWYTTAKPFHVNPPDEHGVALLLLGVIACCWVLLRVVVFQARMLVAKRWVF